METVLYLAHTESDGSLEKSALEALGGAKTLVSSLGDARLAVGLFGEQVDKAAGSIASCGAENFFGVSGVEFGQARYASDAAAVEALCRQGEARIIVAPGTSRCLRVLGGVALRLGGAIDTHVTGISVVNGAVSVTRWHYRQRMEAELQRTVRPWVIAVDPGSSSPWEGEAGSASVKSVSPEIEGATLRTSVSGTREPQADEQTIRPDAELLFVAGAGWTKKQPDGQVRTAEGAELIQDFLRKTSASLGSSKSLVDMETEGQGVLPFLTHLNQIGQTGSTPRHPKGLATCCHGEEPHVVGWRFINERRAVNLNPNCGWAQGKADVLYVADAFEVMAKVNELLAGK